ncbi:MAG: YhdH/YhfP family quinone oxidoreductase [Spirochaeta sp.]|nr:YhdH/YhfP family quinone oxidoreductase [Spirochaeta sp.]
MSQTDSQFRALRVYKTEQGMECRLEQFPEADLPALADGEVRIAVEYSSLNYKDALSANGAPGVTKNYPHTPGIDAAGAVLASSDPRFTPGDAVVVTGFDLGMNTAGGHGEYIRVPGDWVQHRPPELSARDAMIFGTAGFTAALSLMAVESGGTQPDDGMLAVSGASGGVGSLSVALADEAGWRVSAGSGKSSAVYSLIQIGAAEVVAREDFSNGAQKPLLPARFAGAIDTVGGETLGALCKALLPRGVVAACGLVSGTDVPVSVFPFILRGVSIQGIDSQSYPAELRAAVWQRLAKSGVPRQLQEAGMVTEITLEELEPFFEHILGARVSGRVIVRVLGSPEAAGDEE